MSTDGDIKLRKALIEDADMVYEWQSFPLARKYFREPKVPTYAEHNKWFRQTVESVEKEIYMIVYCEEDAGFIRLDYLDKKPEVAEVSILISPCYQSMGIAKKAVRLLQETHPYLIISATVHKENIPSQKLFMACGFSQESDTKFCYRPDHN